jgi:hypothetical protein
VSSKLTHAEWLLLLLHRTFMPKSVEGCFGSICADHAQKR